MFFKLSSIVDKIPVIYGVFRLKGVFHVLGAKTCKKWVQSGSKIFFASMRRRNHHDEDETVIFSPRAAKNI
jgi:hypothetical protein